MVVLDEVMFLYDILVLFGDENLEIGKRDYISLNIFFLLFGSDGSLSREDFVVELIMLFVEW